MFRLSLRLSLGIARPEKALPCMPPVADQSRPRRTVLAKFPGVERHRTYLCRWARFTPRSGPADKLVQHPALALPRSFLERSVFGCLYWLNKLEGWMTPVRLLQHQSRCFVRRRSCRPQLVAGCVSGKSGRTATETIGRQKVKDGDSNSRDRRSEAGQTLSPVSGKWTPSRTNISLSTLNNPVDFASSLDIRQDCE